MTAAAPSAALRELARTAKKPRHPGLIPRAGEEGDRVFVTSAVNSPVEHHVLCFQVSDGKLLWDTSVPPGPWLLKDLRGGYGAPTPATDGKSVFVVFGSAVIASLDFDGELVWRKELEKYAFDVALGSSPVLHGDTVILDCDQTGKTSSFIGFDKAAGTIKWEEKRPQANFAHSTPVLANVKGKAQLLVSASGAVQGLDPATGKIIWWCAAPGDASSPAFNGSLVFADSGRGGRAVCVDPTGEGDVTKTHVLWKHPTKHTDHIVSPLVVGDRMLLIKCGGIATCFNIAKGDQIYGPGRIENTGDYFASPIYGDGKIFIAGENGNIVVLRDAPQLDILAVNDMGDPILGTPAIADGALFVRTRKSLLRIQ